MNSNAFAMAFVIGLSVADISGQPRVEGPCLSLTGSVHFRESFGPPNYGENPKTDSRLRSWILKLRSPVNVVVRDARDDESEVDGLEEVQLVGRPDAEFKQGADSQIATFVGCLYFAESGHHVTKVFLDLASPVMKR